MLNKYYQNQVIHLKLQVRISNYEKLWTFKDSIIKDMHYKGMPRTEGRDIWFRFCQSLKKGQKIDNQTVNYLLGYNGKHNIISVFEVVK